MHGSDEKINFSIMCVGSEGSECSGIRLHPSSHDALKLSAGGKIYCFTKDKAVELLEDNIAGYLQELKIGRAP